MQHPSTHSSPDASQVPPFPSADSRLCGLREQLQAGEYDFPVLLVAERLLAELLRPHELAALGGSGSSAHPAS